MDILRTLTGKTELHIVFTPLAHVTLCLGKHDRAALGAVPFIIIDSLDRLRRLKKTYGVIGAHGFRDEG